MIFLVLIRLGFERVIRSIASFLLSFWGSRGLFFCVLRRQLWVFDKGSCGCKQYGNREISCF